jgi:hypothetical protein
MAAANNAMPETEEEPAHCGECKVLLPKNEKCIACDICGTWFHINCANINANLYKTLANCKDNALGWYCKICRKVTQPLCVKVAQLKIEQDSLRERLKKLEDNSVTKDEVATKVRESLEQPAVKETVKNIVKELGVPGTDETYAAARQALVDRDEEAKQRNNIIIHRLEESTAADHPSQEEEDKNRVIQILRTMDKDMDEDNVDEMTRLGDRKDDRNRPILVRLVQDYEKAKIMDRLKNLKDTNWNVSISNDLPKGTRSYHRNLIDKARAEKGADAVNFTFRVTGAPGREKVVSKAKK